MHITRAALMYSDGEVFEGFSYTNISSLARKLGYSGEPIRGFIDSAGEFLLPHDAAVTAEKSGQITKSVSELSPDDLWPGVDNGD